VLNYIEVLCSVVIPPVQTTLLFGFIVLSDGSFLIDINCTRGDWLLDAPQCAEADSWRGITFNWWEVPVTWMRRLGTSISFFTFTLMYVSSTRHESFVVTAGSAALSLILLHTPALSRHRCVVHINPGGLQLFLLPVGAEIGCLSASARKTGSAQVGNTCIFRRVRLGHAQGSDWTQTSTHPLFFTFNRK